MYIRMIFDKFSQFKCHTKENMPCTHKSIFTPRLLLNLSNEFKIKDQNLFCLLFDI